jgi:hypothetical protein
MQMKNRFVMTLMAVSAVFLFQCNKPAPEKNCNEECAAKIKADSIAEFKKRAPIEMIANQPAEAAAKGLINVKKAADMTSFRMLGFESLEEVDKAEVGKAIPYIWLGCGLVLNKGANADSMKSLVIRSQTMYLVKSGNKNRCGIMVEGTIDPDEKKRGAFGVTSFGDAVFAKDYDSALVRFSTIKAADESGLMLVNVVAAGIPLWATSLEPTGYVLPYVSHSLPCLAKFKKPVTWRELFKSLQACKDVQVNCSEAALKALTPPDSILQNQAQQSAE